MIARPLAVPARNSAVCWLMSTMLLPLGGRPLPDQTPPVIGLFTKFANS